MNATDLQEELNLPQERAERVVELLEKREQGGISQAEFLEVAANLWTRREMLYNDAVSVPGVKTFFGLKHLEGTEPSVNDLLRAEYGEDYSRDEIKEIYEDVGARTPGEGAPIFLSSGIVLFHEADIEITDEDNPLSSFEITPQTATDHAPEETSAEDEDDGTAAVDVDAAF